MKALNKSDEKKVGIKEIKFLFSGLLPKKTIIFLAIILLLLENIISVGIPYIIMKFIDKVDLNNINVLIVVGIFMVFIFQLIVATVAAYILTYIAEYLIMNLRQKVLKKVLSLPISFFDKTQTGEIMSRVYNDTLIIKDFIIQEASIFLSDMLSLIGSVVLIYIIDWKIGIIVTIASPLSSVLISTLADREFDVSVSLQEETANFQALINMIISEIRLVKSYVAEKMEYNNSEKVIKKIYKLSLKEGKILAFIRPFTTSIMFILLVAIFGYGSLRVAQGTITAGGLIAIIMYLFQMSSPASGIASFYTGYQKFCGAVMRLKELNNYPVEITTANTTPARVVEGISFENVSFYYDKSKTVLKNVSFSIGKGKATGLIGPSGAGKTTIFSLLERFYLPASGQIYYEGRSIWEYDIEEWRSKIAYVSQESPVMYGSILSNLVYGVEKYTQEQVEMAVKNAKLEDYIESLPDKYDTVVGERGVTLSGGQRQRLAIARAMLRNPEILLLDEATSHLDSDSEKLVKESLAVLMEGRTTLIIAHNLSTVKDADKLIVLEDGLISGQGKHEDLIKTHELYQRFIEQQTY